MKSLLPLFHRGAAYLSGAVQNIVMHAVYERTIACPQGNKTPLCALRALAVQNSKSSYARRARTYKYLEPLGEKADSLRQLSAYIVERQF